MTIHDFHSQTEKLHQLELRSNFVINIEGKNKSYKKMAFHFKISLFESDRNINVVLGLKWKF
jgi:hypothetical protein